MQVEGESMGKVNIKTASVISFVSAYIAPRVKEIRSGSEGWDLFWI